MSRSVQIRASGATDPPMVGLFLTVDDEEPEQILVVSVDRAYQLFSEGRQICLTIKPELERLEEIPEEWRV